MSKHRWSFYLVLGGGAVLLGLNFAPAQRPERLDGLIAPPLQQTEIIQQFPSYGPAQTAWKVRWRTQNGPGLIIEDAYFKKNPNDPWTQIIGEARLGESFVPYHRGSPRFWDVSYNFPLCHVTKVDGGANGKLLSAAPGSKGSTPCARSVRCGSDATRSGRRSSSPPWPARPAACCGSSASAWAPGSSLPS